MRIPTVVFVNKTDRMGADADAAVRRIPDAVPMWNDVREFIAERDDSALAASVDDRPLPPGTLARLVADAAILPGAAPESRPADFRRLISELVPLALARAGTVVCEPFHHAELEGPADTLPAVLSALPGLGAVIDSTVLTGSVFSVGALIAADHLSEVARHAKVDAWGGNARCDVRRLACTRSLSRKRPPSPRRRTHRRTARSRDDGMHHH